MLSHLNTIYYIKVLNSKLIEIIDLDFGVED